jgi:hypothetical protein
MTIPALLVPNDRADGAPLSRLILSARYSDCALTARTGQVPTFSRAATASVVDDLGTAFTLGFHTPAYERRDWLRTSARTHTGIKHGTSDRLSYAATFVPRPMWFWLAFMHIGGIPAAGTPLLSITIDAATGARLVLDSSGSVWRLLHDNGASSRTASMAVAPVDGDSVILRGQLYLDGSVQLWQSINFAAESDSGRTAAPTSGTLASSWGTGARVRLGATGTSAFGSLWAHRLKLGRGVPTYAQMARAA